MAEVTVGVLGPVEVRVDGEIVPLHARVERGVLATLVVRLGHPVPVEVVYDDVWGDRRPASWRKSVHVAMSRLRDRLGRAGVPDDVIVTTDDGYRLTLDRMAVDTSRLNDSLAEARGLLDAGRAGEAEALLAEALDLWRGDPLQEIADSAAGQAEAARLQELHQAAIDVWGEAALAGDHHDALIARLEAELVADPLRERRWGQLMVALYRSGRQADSLRAYQRARTVLNERLGIEPGPELRRLEAAVLAQEVDVVTAWSPVDSPALATPRPPRGGEELIQGPLDWIDRQREVPLVGRDVDLKRLLAQWEDTKRLPASGAGFISGGAGVGKTRLAAEVAAVAAADGALVLAARCVPGGGLSPLIAAAAPLGLPTPTGDLGPGSPVAFEFLVVVYERLREIAASRPVLIILDDMQWADAHAVGAIQFLEDRPLPRPNPVPFMGLVLHRSDVALPHGLRRAIADARRMTLHSDVELQPLVIDEARSLFTERLGSAAVDVSDRVVADLASACGGNAAYLVQLAQHVAVAAGSGRFDDGDDDVSVESVGLPDTLRQAIEEDLAERPRSVTRVLLAASVTGGPFTGREVAAGAGVDEDEALDALDEAVAAGWIEETGDRPGEYGFVVPLERQVLLDRLSESRRQLIQGRLASGP